MKRFALKIEKIKKLGYKPRMSSREAVRATVQSIVESF